MMKDKLNKTMQRMDKAYTLLGRIPVTGDSVDVMALVRMELRESYADMATLKAELEKRPAGAERRGASAAGQNGGVSEEGLCPTGDMKSEWGPCEALPSGENEDGQTDRG